MGADGIPVPEGMEWFDEYFREFTEYTMSRPIVCSLEEADASMRALCNRGGGVKLSGMYLDMAEYGL